MGYHAPLFYFFPAALHKVALLKRSFVISARPDFPWQRFWYPINQPIPTTDGYLSDAGSDDAVGPYSLEQVEPWPCLVLLGAPGMGKSREALHEVSRLRVNSAKVDLVNAPESADQLTDLLARSNAQAWLQHHSEWSVFIDAVDEMQGGANAFLQPLRRFIDMVVRLKGDLTKLKLRVLCRTAEWTDELNDILGLAWGSDRRLTLQLAPLRQSDVRTAAQRFTTSPQATDDFMASVGDREIQALASRPVLLRLLLDLFDEKGVLPPRQADLYSRGIQVLLDEPQILNGTREKLSKLDTSSRLVVACRLAAVSALGFRSLIWTGPPEGAPAGAFSIDEVEGGFEPSPPFSFPVSRADLLDVIRTPLFVASGQNLYQWAHKTFVEYLAARYFVEHSIPPREILALLSVPGAADAAGIAPQYREIAAWAATLDSAVFDLLIDREPDVLLSSDVASAAPTYRARLIDALLSKFNHEELLDVFFNLRSSFAKLNHPNISQQLLSFISDRTHSDIGRRAAIDIAEETGQAVLSSKLADIAKDPTESIIVRKDAAVAVRRLGDIDQKSRLIEILDGDLSADRDDELRGAVLHATWPSSLKFDQLLKAITPPKNSNFIGNYRQFLYTVRFEKLSEADALQAIEWLKLQIRRAHDPRSDLATEKLLPRLFWAVVSKGDSTAVQDALAELILEAMDRVSHGLFGDSQADRPAWEEIAVDRIELVSRVLSVAKAPVKAGRMLLFWGQGLIAKSDLDQYVNRITTEANPNVREALIDITVSLAAQTPIEDLNHAWTVAETAPDLEDGLRRVFSVELDSPNAEWMRDSFRREQQQEAAKSDIANKSAEIDAAIAKALGAVLRGDYDSWWRLNILLFYAANGEYDHDQEFLGDLRSSPGWARLTEGKRGELLQAAKLYIANAPPTRLRWLGSNTQDRPSAAAVRALRLVAALEPETFAQYGNEVWRKFAGAVLGFTDNDFHRAPGPRNELVAQAYRHAPANITNAIARLALGPKSNGLDRQSFDLLHSIFDEKIGTLLEKIRKRKSAKGGTAEDSLSVLIARRFQPTAIAIRQYVDTFEESILSQNNITTPDGQEDGTAPKAGRIAYGRALARLLEIAAPGDWERAITAGGNCADLGREIWTAYADQNRRNWQSLDIQSEETIERLYSQLDRLFPQPDEREGARFLGVTDFVAGLRTYALSLLVNRGSAEALAALDRLVGIASDPGYIRWRISEAQRNYRAHARQNMQPRDVIDSVAALGIRLPHRNEIAAAEAAILLGEDDASKVVKGEILKLGEMPEEVAIAGQEEKPFRILTVATEWSSGKGGVSTFNREVCIALAAEGHEVACLVPDADPDAIASARAMNVRLIGAPKIPCLDPGSRVTSMGPADFPFPPDAVLGHDHITGPQALALARMLGCHSVVVLHTTPSSTEPYKARPGDTSRSVLAGDVKDRNQWDISRSADLVVSVGPRIHDQARMNLRQGKELLQFLPGLTEELLDHQPRAEDLPVSYCLLFGRMEDPEVKGVSIGVEAVKAVRDNVPLGMLCKPNLILRGFDPGRANEEYEMLKLPEDRNDFVEVKAYSSDMSVIHDDIRKASVIIMPSKSEGFGLSALEAISAGVPVVVSDQSGLGKFLIEADANQLIDKEIVKACVAEVGSGPQFIAGWSERLGQIFADRESAFKNAASLRTALKTHLSWRKSSRALVAKLRSLPSKR